MSKLIRKSHNVSNLMYHFVCPAKYRKVVFGEEVELVLGEVCEEIEKRYEISFLEIGTDKDHVHFLIQSVPSYSPSKIIQVIKSITAREIFRRVPSVKKQLWGGEFWTDGFFVSTVGEHASERVIQRYIQNQGKREEEYKPLHKKKTVSVQLTLL